MDIKELQNHVDARFDKIEDKMDAFMIQTTNNTNDLTWVKGSVKLGITLLITAVGFVISTLVGISPLK